MKIFAALALSVGILFLPAAPVAAHILESNNGVNGVLHIEPGDSAVAGRAADLHFYLGSLKPGFRAQDCGCSLTISQQGKHIASPHLRLSDRLATASDVTFPHSGAYTLVLTGKDFRLSYNVPVTTAPSSFNLKNPGVQILAGCLLVVAMVVGIAWRTAAKHKRLQ